MKYILFSIIFIFVCLLCASALAEEWEIQESLLISIYELDGGEDFLKAVSEKIDLLEEALLQIETDQEEINQARYQRDKLRQDIYVIRTQINALKNENNILQSQIGNDTGLYAGAVIGYPFFTGIALIEYRFPQWSPMIVGGYSSRAFIGAGINIKVGK